MTIKISYPQLDMLQKVVRAEAKGEPLKFGNTHAILSALERRGLVTATDDGRGIFMCRWTSTEKGRNWPGLNP